MIYKYAFIYIMSVSWCLRLYILTCKLYACMWVDVCMMYIRCVYIKSLHVGKSKTNLIIYICLYFFYLTRNYVRMYGYV